MKLLDSDYVRNNMFLLSSSLGKVGGEAISVKKGFVFALNSLQKVGFEYSESIKVVFDKSEISSGLVRVGVLNESEVEKSDFIFDQKDRKKIELDIRNALDLVRNSVSPKLHDLLNLLINNVFCCNIDRLGGGSVTCYVSLVWLAPKKYWTVTTYAENLVHEYIHQSLFLDDMINNVFPNPEELSSLDAMATSSILKIKRHFDKAFHSAYVSIALMYFYHQLKSDEKAHSFYPALKQTIEELIDRESYISSKGRIILSKHGKKLLTEMNEFAKNPNYENISDTL